MNSRERVAAAIAQKPVDRVPLGFYTVDFMARLDESGALRDKYQEIQRRGF